METASQGALFATTWERGFSYAMRAQQRIIAACVAVVVASGVTVFVRNRTDPFLFMDVDERTKAAVSASVAEPGPIAWPARDTRPAVGRMPAMPQ